MISNVGPLLTFAALFGAIASAIASTQSATGLKVGDVYQIVLDRRSVTEGTNASSGSSDDRDVIVERVAAVHSDGVELVIDLPPGATAAERADEWQFPARILKPFYSPPRLLNRSELERRIDPWLKHGGMTRAAYGRLIFTWNVFRIDCDPDSAIQIAMRFDPQPPDLFNGARYTEPDAIGATGLEQTAIGPSGRTYTAQLTVDPDAIRRERAQTDVEVGEISGRQVSLDAASKAHAADAVTGTIKVTFETDLTGQVWRRTRLIRCTVTTPGKGAETRTTTEILERKRLP